ncbi:oligopeptide transporter protein [Myriangium duriaei CBS 260.36]|uniref:Oligopeptide transporter protein n=1 Tax=Myriangium duriaei CBS 260.36 TaxID=1168546 RepID=A0A9P4ISF1_9PEZI|nr:oligopeptide transporter protein [Myriangium duriaei CBS 260.36]
MRTDLETTVPTAAPKKSEKIEAASSNASVRGRPRLEDYVFFAEVQRASDKIQHGPGSKIADKLHKIGCGLLPVAIEPNPLGGEEQTTGLTDHEVEKVQAWRALRQASWAGAFYLCTTDILGPFNAPYAFRQNGYIPGTLLYVFMGTMAFYCGGLLWWLYIKLDSDRFPVKSYSDITERTAGRPMRVLVTWLVFIHMIVNVATTSLSAAQSLYQLAKGNICFVVAVIIWIIVGCILNQIRTLKRYSWLASSAIWLNILVILLSVGFIAHSEPNYAAAKASYGISAGPVIKTAFASYPFYERINGVMNIVHAYGGATIFPQIIAEMRQPMDFLKAFSVAQALIFTIYVFYGLYVYSFQGQYTLAVAYQGVSRYSWQTVGNVLSLISTVIAGGLYGNIGLKIFYQNVVERFLHGPSLLTRKGRFAWSALVIIFWWVGFVIGAAIPQVQTLSGMVGAVTNMHFTYSFPTGFTFLYLVQLDATTDDEAYSPGKASRRSHRWLQVLKWFNFIICLAALATAGLGIYGSGLSIASAFDSSAATSFGCAAPV